MGGTALGEDVGCSLFLGDMGAGVEIGGLEQDSSRSSRVGDLEETEGHCWVVG